MLRSVHALPAAVLAALVGGCCSGRGAPCPERLDVSLFHDLAPGPYRVVASAGTMAVDCEIDVPASCGERTTCLDGGDLFVWADCGTVTDRRIRIWSYFLLADAPSVLVYRIERGTTVVHEGEVVLHYSTDERCDCAPVATENVDL